MGRKLFLFLGILASSLLASLAGAEPVRVAVIDAPVDYTHGDITPYLDHETLERIRVRGGRITNPADRDGTTSLGEYNAAAMARAIQALDPALYEEQVRVLDLLTRQSAKEKLSEEDQAFLRSIRYKLMLNGRYRAQLNTLGTALHGTHVAGMVVDQLDPERVRLVSYPFLDVAGSRVAAGRATLRERLLTRLMGNGCSGGVVCAPQGVVVDYLKHNAMGLLQGLMAAVTDPARLEQQMRESTRQHYGQLSLMLQQGGVRVANMSLGFGLSMSLESALRSVGFLSRILFRDAITRMITVIMRVQQEELRRFFAENPNTAFVVAAGNDSVDVARPGDYHSAAVDGPNVLTVAATNFNGQLAEFSNVSTQSVEIAAPGVVVRSARAGAGESRDRVSMSGTSMAAPIVTNRVAQILSENPEFTPQQAIRSLLENHTVILSDLKKSINGGRWMLPRSLVGQVSGEVAQIEGHNQESYMAHGSCQDALTPAPSASNVVEFSPAPRGGSEKAVEFYAEAA